VTVALYPGTFDPVTHGHVDIVTRAAGLFERVIVAVGARIDKATLFPPEERVAMFRAAVRDLSNVSVEPFTGLVVDLARARGARLLVRGVRTIADFEYEAQMAQTNRRLYPQVDTVFLLPDPRNALISSTLIREIVKAGGSVAEFVPPGVVEAFRRLRPPA
jgi:pantetheine-phosphate adenylyltransferase